MAGARAGGRPRLNGGFASCGSVLGATLPTQPSPPSSLQRSLAAIPHSSALLLAPRACRSSLRLAPAPLRHRPPPSWSRRARPVPGRRHMRLRTGPVSSAIPQRRRPPGPQVPQVPGSSKLAGQLSGFRSAQRSLSGGACICPKKHFPFSAARPALAARHKHSALCRAVRLPGPSDAAGHPWVRRVGRISPSCNVLLPGDARDLSGCARASRFGHVPRCASVEIDVTPFARAVLNRRGDVKRVGVPFIGAAAVQAPIYQVTAPRPPGQNLPTCLAQQATQYPLQLPRRRRHDDQPQTPFEILVIFLFLQRK